MEYIFETSGEQPKLAIGEIKGLLEAYGIKYSIENELTNLVILKTQNKLSKRKLSRLGFTHSVYKEISVSKNLEEIKKDAETISTKKDFCVRAKRIENTLPQVNSSEIEDEVGSKINGEVDLEDPQKLFKVFLSKGKLVFGERILKINRSNYRKRKPHKRPFFKPGAIEPELARAAINLCRTKNGPLLDIFSGTGSFLIEALEMDIESLGIDASRKMLIESRKNFDIMNKDSEPSLVRADSKNMPFKDNQFDAVIADPPYGRSSKTFDDLEKLYNETIGEALRVLAKGGVLCFITPSNGVDLKVDIDEIKRYKVRVHRSLTRIIRLFRR